VDFEQQAGIRADGPLVVVEVGAVGGPYLAQPGPALAHHIRNTKRAADLHQLTPGHHGLPPLGQAVQGKQHGTGIVIDHRSSLGSGELGQQAAEMVVTAAANPLSKIVLEVAVHRGQLGHPPGSGR